QFMYGGDTAIVGVQYSFLPSWIGFLLDTKSPRVLGEALFKGVHDAWAQLPAGHRPLLVAYGESLGSLGGEQAFAAGDLHTSIDNITSQTDATLFVGPTRSNPVFGGAIDQRDAGSNTWKPVLAAEPHVRFANNIADITADGSQWPSPRVLYLHHPSDAIGTWQPSNLWSSPGWADDPPPYDVPGAATWLPFVTFTQESFDLMNGFSAAPGYGHDYRNAFVHAWAALLQPKGWTEADSQSLLTFLRL
ncbi:MAG: alpha/beta-hydrolase family protein, partial [Actinomycetota bacterium]